MIRSKIETLDENSLREQIMIPLLRSIVSIRKVESWHGPTERGKDVYFSFENPFGENIHCCLFIKRGNIGLKDIRDKYKPQLEEALERDDDDPSFGGHPKTRMAFVYVTCNGTITGPARSYLADLDKVYPGRIRDIDIDWISGFIEKQFDHKKKRHTEFAVEEYGNFCDEYRGSSETTEQDIALKSEGAPVGETRG